MLFTSTTFLFVFLPIILIVYYIFPKKLAKYSLLFASIVFCAGSSLFAFACVIVSMLCNLLVGRYMDGQHKKEKSSKKMYIIGLTFNILVLVFYKVYVDVIPNELVMDFYFATIGMSFFSFKAISYLTDIHNSKIQLSNNPLDDALYLIMFTHIQSGPIARYSDMYDLEKEGTFSKKDCFSDGIYRFSKGLCKKVLLADMLAKIANEAFAIDAQLSVSMAWLGAICFSLQLYFDFSGFSDMAIGLTKAFGYECPENFDYPYVTKTISEFFRRWHISLGHWFRDYVYIPLGGSRCKQKSKIYRNLFIVWLLTALWHGFGLTYLVWGLAYFVLIACEKIVGVQKISNKVLQTAYRLLTLFVINLLWVVFRCTSMKQAVWYWKCMFINTNNSVANVRANVLLGEYFIILLVAIVLCFPIEKWISKVEQMNGKACIIGQIIKPILVAAFTIIAIAFIVSGQNNPFLYANF